PTFTWPNPEGRPKPRGSMPAAPSAASPSSGLRRSRRRVRRQVLAADDGEIQPDLDADPDPVDFHRDLAVEIPAERAGGELLGLDFHGLIADRDRDRLGLGPEFIPADRTRRLLGHDLSSPGTRTVRANPGHEPGRTIPARSGSTVRRA